MVGNGQGRERAQRRRGSAVVGEQCSLSGCFLLRSRSLILVSRSLIHVSRSLIHDSSARHGVVVVLAVVHYNQSVGILLLQMANSLG